MWRHDSLEKTLMFGGIGSRRRRGRQRMKWLMTSPTRWTWVWVYSGCWWWTGKSGVLRFMGLQKSDMTEWLNWTELNVANVNLLYSTGNSTQKEWNLKKWAYIQTYSWFTLLYRRNLTQHCKATTYWKWMSLSHVWLFETPWSDHGILQARILEYWSE